MEQRSEKSGRRGGFVARLGMGWGGTAGFLACLLAGTCAAANVGEVKWEFKPAGGTVGSPAIGTEGTVYVASGNKFVYALDGATGAKKWEFDTGSYGMASPVIGADGTVYVAVSSVAPSYRGLLYALDGATGTPKWEFSDDGGFTASPAVGMDGTVFAGTSTTNFFALEGSTGVKKWAFGAETGFSLAPVLGADETVYVGSGDGKVLALDGGTGTRKWVFEPGGFVTTSAALGADGTLYVGCSDNWLYALDGGTGAKRWLFTTGNRAYRRDGIASAPVIGVDGTIYFGANDGKVYALDGTLGFKRWEFITGYCVVAAPALTSDGTLYVGSQDHQFYALDAATGTKRWSLDLGGEINGSPAIGADGTVYVGVSGGSLFAIQGGAGLALSPWPQFQKDPAHRGSSQRSGPPEILRQSASGVAAAGKPLPLAVVASGTSPLDYQWYFNDVPLAQGTGSLYTVPAFSAGDAGTYSVVISNGLGGITSAPVSKPYGYAIDAQSYGPGAVVKPDQEAYTPGTNVQLLAKSATGRQFVRWEGDAQGTNIRTKLMIDRNLEVIARFEALPGDRIWERIIGQSPAGDFAMSGNGTLYFGDDPRHHIYAVDSATGATKWEFAAGDLLLGPIALGPDGTVYAGSLDHHVYALNATTGFPKWSFGVGGSVFGTPAVGPDGTLYLGSSDGNLYALASLDGTVKWVVPAVGAVGCPVIGADGTLFAGVATNTFCAFDGATGAKKWSFAAGGACGSPALGGDGTVYVGAADGKLHALEGNTGAKKWEFPAITGPVVGSTSLSSPAIDAGGTVYFGASNGRFFALDGLSGAKKWEFASEGGGFSSPVIGADGTVYAGASDFYVYALDSVLGTKQWSYRTGGALMGSPALANDGIMYVAAGRKIYALQTSSGLAHSPWPKWRGDNANTGCAPRPGAPRLQSQTKGGAYTAGTALNLEVTLDGTVPMQFQWYRNGEPLPGATGAVYAIASLGPATAGSYYMVVENTQGQVRSGDIVLDVRYILELVAIGPGKAGKQPNQRQYEPGTVVRLTANPEPGRGFVGWQGDLNDTSAVLQVTMDRNLRMVASFEALPGDQVWEFETGGPVRSSPALGVEGSLVVGSDDKKVYALDQLTGAKRWEFATGGAVRSSPAIGADGTVYVGSLDNLVYALNGTNGSQQWAFKTRAEVYSSPAIGLDETVYVGSMDGTFYALDGRTGAQKWASPAAVFSESSPVIGEDGTVFFGGYFGVFHALDGMNGIEKWQASFSESFGFAGFTQSPALGSGGVVNISEGGGNLYALNGGTGRVIWQSKPSPGQWGAGPPAIDAAGRIIVCQSPRVLALDPTTGSQIWSVAVPSADSAVPAIGADATVYVGSRDQNLYALDGATGTVKWKFAVNGEISSSPTIGSDGTVYFGSADKKVRAIRGNSFGGLADSAWPKFHRSVDNRGSGQREGRPEVVTLSGGGLARAGSSPVLSVSAAGSAPFRYQWFFENRPLTEGTNASFQVPVFGPGQAGSYSVVVSNAAGWVQSAPIRLDPGYRCVASASAHGIVTRDPDQELYALGTTLRWAAEPEECWRFGFWSGDVDSTNRSVSVTVDRDLSVQAQFEPLLGAKMWEFVVDGPVLSAVAAGLDGTVYVSTANGFVYGLDGDTGVPKWTTRLTNEVCAQPAVGGDGTVYVGTSVGQLRALDGRSGAVRWKSPIAGSIDFAPAIGAEETIYVGSTKGSLSAVGGANGTILWQFPLGNPIEASPAIGRDDTIYAVCKGGSVYALAGLTGKLKWSFSDTRLLQFRSPAIGADGSVYLSAQFGLLLAFDGASGVKRWEYGPCFTFMHPLIDGNGMVLSQSDGSHVSAFDGGSGRLGDSYPIFPGLGSTPMLGAGRAIYFWTTEGRIVALDRGTGTTNWVSAQGEYANDASLLIGTNGFIYVGSGYGTRVYAFKGDAMLEDSAWPKEHHDSRNSGKLAGAPGNHPPVLADIADQTLKAGETFTLRLSASDADLPPQALSFSLPPYPPPGMTLDALTGVLTWVPPENRWTSTNMIAVRVTDGEGGSATNQFTLFVKDPRRQWTVGIIGGFNSCPALGRDGTVYASTWAGQLFAFAGDSGAQKWVRSGVASEGNAPVVGPDGTVYCASRDANLYALDAATGATQWQYPTDGLATSPAFGADGTLYWGTTNGSVYALAGGALKWKIHARGAILAPPALAADGSVYVGTSERTLLALAGADGQAQWESALGGAMRSPPAIGLDGMVYVGSDAGKILALAAATGAQQWEYVTEGAVEGSPIVGPDGTVYAGSLGGRIYALDGVSGRKRWEVSTAEGVVSTPALAADGTLYVGGTDNRLYAWDVATERRKWTHLVGYMLRASPAIGTDGTVYIGSGDTVLLALNPDARAGLAPGGWPKFQGNARNTGNVLDSTANHPPVLTMPTNQVVDELTRLRLPVSAADADAPANRLLYTLVSAPEGMSLDPVSGALDWTPTEVQGPSTNPVVVRVIDDGLPPLGDTGRFQVIVNEVNRPPVLTTAPRDFTVKAGHTLSFTNTATDPDWPSNALVFARGLDFPDGAALDRQTGVFGWTAPLGRDASTNRFSVWVTDNGNPYQSASGSFTIVVLPVPAAPRLSAVKVEVAGLVVISWEADPGARYQVQYKTNLAEPAWVNAGGVVAAATLVEAIPTGTESQRFYRIILLEEP